MQNSTPMTKAAEAKVLDAVRSISGYVAEGHHPTDAVVKVAQDLRLPPNTLDLVTRAYNVGRTTWQQDFGGDGILNKQAEFPIARIEDVRRSLYPTDPVTPAAEKAAAAVSEAYDHAPVSRQTITKAAHTRLPIAERIERQKNAHTMVKRAFSKAAEEKRALEDARRSYTNTRDHLQGAMGAVRDYFKQAEFLREDFSTVAYNSRLMFGEPAESVLDFARKEAGLAEPGRFRPGLVQAREDMAPYSLVKHAIDCGRQLLQDYKLFSALEKAAHTDVHDVIRPFTTAPNRHVSRTPSVLGAASSETEKGASFFSPLIGAGIGASMKGLSQQKDPEQQVTKVEQQLTDPQHMQEIREIHARALLNDLMTNDEVISGYDPEEITEAFNEISQLSPRASTQPAVLRPLLRKQLTQGAIDPHETEQMVNIEKGIAGTSTAQPDPLIAQGPGAVEKPEMSEALGGNPLLQ